MSDVAVIIVAAGKSTRFSDENYKKPFVSVNGRALWLYSVDRFIKRDDVKQLILVIAEADQQIFDQRFGTDAASSNINVVHGGNSRAASVLNGLKVVDKDVGFVVVHDAARPCLSDIWLDELFVLAKQTGAAILGTPVVSTVKRVAADSISETISRDGLWESQTPQMFDKSKLLGAYESAEDYASATDEAQLMEWAGHRVSVVQASPLNRKVTTQQDLRFIELAMQVLHKENSEGSDV
ncbi:MAG: 2-C-methyl-D-erythritol 4-phosphate cytidylyltransferase [Planctomycetaceae bacterium]|nr:2-C-methyl-D-erythritol 4-phosphate cytidylyltransferase [Planctomycetaceae bacterium]|tara:strand:+ start:860 stop:1573 length:714 start_codon:yes stop_codon:yes gene_type:complete